MLIPHLAICFLILNLNSYLFVFVSKCLSTPVSTQSLLNESAISNRLFQSKPGNSPYHTVGSTIPAPNTPETYGDWNLSKRLAKNT